MTALRCPNPAAVEVLRADTSTLKLCGPCAQRNPPDDIVATLPVLGSRRPAGCESTG